DIVTVPFGGGGPMVQSVVGGHTPVAFATLPSASAQIKDGLLRALAVTSTRRIAILPDVPTMEEAGVPRPGARGTAMRLGTRRYPTRDRRSFVPRDRACGCFARPQGENGGDRI